MKATKASLRVLWTSLLASAALGGCSADASLGDDGPLTTAIAYSVAACSAAGGRVIVAPITGEPGGLVGPCGALEPLGPVASPVPGQPPSEVCCPADEGSLFTGAAPPSDQLPLITPEACEASDGFFQPWEPGAPDAGTSELPCDGAAWFADVVEDLEGTLPIGSCCLDLTARSAPADGISPQECSADGGSVEMAAAAPDGGAIGPCEGGNFISNIRPDPDLAQSGVAPSEVCCAYPATAEPSSPIDTGVPRDEMPETGNGELSAEDCAAAGGSVEFVSDAIDPDAEILEPCGGEEPIGRIASASLSESFELCCPGE